MAGRTWRSLPASVLLRDCASCPLGTLASGLSSCEASLRSVPLPTPASPQHPSLYLLPVVLRSPEALRGWCLSSPRAWLAATVKVQGYLLSAWVVCPWPMC